MLSIRYRGTIIRTSAFKLLFLGVFSIGLVMFMRLQGLFLAMPLSEDKQSPTGSAFPRHPKHFISSAIFTPVARPLKKIQSELLLLKTTVLDNIRTFSYKVPSVENVQNPSETSINLKEVREFVRKLNLEEKVKNLDKFPRELTEKSMVIIVQVHNRPDYFAHLLRSLSKAKGIENALLVVSHDFYNEYINSLVDAINFCKVVQIFFPYSMQLYPDRFPGTDPKDCPRDAKPDEAKKIGCINAEHPDRYGHFREAKFTMTKHHWWWKANTVFDGLNITRNYNGPVVFLEEDHYVSPDFYHVLDLMYHVKQTDSRCKDGCDILTLGTYTVPQIYKAVGENTAELMQWKSSRHNMGMTFDRNTWNAIKDCKDMFCTYDDYNWDWTLMKISLSCVKRAFGALVMKAPRIYHIGECGMHHKKNCNPKQATVKFNNIINDNANSLFPSSLQLQSKSLSNSIGNPNGGWGDTRDHELCQEAVRT